MAAIAEGQSSPAIEPIVRSPHDGVHLLQPIRDAVVLINPLRHAGWLLAGAEEEGDALDGRWLGQQSDIEIKLALLIDTTDQLPRGPLPRCPELLAFVVADLNHLLRRGQKLARTGE